jgi:hypothetical protein
MSKNFHDAAKHLIIKGLWTGYRNLYRAEQIPVSSYKMFTNKITRYMIKSMVVACFRAVEGTQRL